MAALMGRVEASRLGGWGGHTRVGSGGYVQQYRSGTITLFWVGVYVLDLCLCLDVDLCLDRGYAGMSFKHTHDFMRYSLIQLDPNLEPCPLLPHPMCCCARVGPAWHTTP